MTPLLDPNARPKPAELPPTQRTAHAVAVVLMPAELAALLKDGEIHTRKGPVFHTAVLAGVMGVKRTSDLIPLCHPVALDDCQIEIKPDITRREITIHCRVHAHARTGVEMEALTGATIAALTLFDMGHAVSPGIIIHEVRLMESTGGKHDYNAAAEY
jgi:cyclic pyranopterin monophosphate synthase